MTEQQFKVISEGIGLLASANLVMIAILDKDKQFGEMAMNLAAGTELLMQQIEEVTSTEEK